MEKKRSAFLVPVRNHDGVGLTYEEMRKFYDPLEQREQRMIVMTQKLMIRLKELEKENNELRGKIY